MPSSPALAGRRRDPALLTPIRRHLAGARHHAVCHFSGSCHGIVKIVYLVAVSAVAVTVNFRHVQFHLIVDVLMSIYTIICTQ
jgi:hypothetical protein